MKKEVLPALQTGGLGDYPFNRIGTEVGRLSAPTHPIGCLYLGGGGVVKIKPQSKGLTGRSVCFNCFISVASFPPSLASLQYQRYITLGSGKGAG